MSPRRATDDGPGAHSTDKLEAFMDACRETLSRTVGLLLERMEAREARTRPGPPSRGQPSVEGPASSKHPTHGHSWDEATSMRALPRQLASVSPLRRRDDRPSTSLPCVVTSRGVAADREGTEAHPMGCTPTGSLTRSARASGLIVIQQSCLSVTRTSVMHATCPPDGRHIFWGQAAPRRATSGDTLAGERFSAPSDLCSSRDK